MGFTRRKIGPVKRLEIPLEAVELPLGEPARLAIHLTGPDALRTAVLQRLTQYNGESKALSLEDMELFDKVKIGPKTMNICIVDHSADGSASVTLVARRPGTVEFRLRMLFRDGGIATRTILVPVKLSDHAPVRMTNRAGGSEMDAEMIVKTMHLLTNAPDRVRSPFPLDSFRWDSEWRDRAGFNGTPAWFDSYRELTDEMRIQMAKLPQD